MATRRRSNRHETLPILFTGPMVRALLDGRKTQTRRLITSMWSNVKMRHDMRDTVLLYVRETWAYVGALDPGLLVFQADYPQCVPAEYEHVPPTLDALRETGYRWKPSIHLPRRRSRLTLEVTDVRLQRLQDISEEDAVAEGFKALTKDGMLMTYGIPDRDGLPGTDGSGWPWAEWNADPRYAYRHLWNCLHGPSAWEDNPKIIALTFRIHHCNVDDLIKQKTA